MRQANADNWQAKQDAKRAEAERLATALNTPVEIIEDVNTITDGDPVKQAKMRRAKGWFDTKTGKVVVVLPNNMNIEDVAATSFHEIVAHKGLRELVGEDNYNDFLHEIYEHAKSDVRRRIGKLAEKNGWNFEKATDEYLGGLSEKGFEDFSEGERSIWQVIKEKVLNAINKFLKSLKLPKWVKLGDNELRYMLWRSHENLRSKDMDPIQQAQDIVKREELKLGTERTFRMGDGKESFKARQAAAEKNKGTVMPGLNELEVRVIKAKDNDFNNFAEAKKWAEKNIVRTYSNSETGNKGVIAISNSVIGKYLSESAVIKSETKDVHLSVLKVLPDVIRESYEVEEHADYTKNKNKGRSVTNEVNKNILIHRLYGAVEVSGKIYRVKVTMKEYSDENTNAKPHAYEATKIEVLVGTLENASSTFPNTSTSNGVGSVPSSNEVSYPLAKLLQNVEKSYDNGKKLLEESKKADESSDFLFRDPGETGEIWSDMSMGLDEKLTAAKTKLANKHAEDKVLKNDAMRAIGGNIANLRKAMSLQRRFDMSTIKRVSDLARILMDNGYLSGLSQQEVKRLLAATKNSVGHEDVEGSVKKVLDIMIDNQLHNASASLYERIQ